MWGRLNKKGLKDVQIVHNRKNTDIVNGKKQEQRLVQEVGTHVNKAIWLPTKEVNEMMAKIKQAILEDQRKMANGT